MSLQRHFEASGRDVLIRHGGSRGRDAAEGGATWPPAVSRRSTPGGYEGGGNQLSVQKTMKLSIINIAFQLLIKTVS